MQGMSQISARSLEQVPAHPEKLFAFNKTAFPWRTVYQDCFLFCGNRRKTCNLLQAMLN